MEPLPLTVSIVIAIFIVFTRHAIKAQRHKSNALATIQGFDPVVKYDGVIGGIGLALDPHTKRFAIAGVGVTPQVFDFSQLIAVDVERDGATITTTKGSNGLAGAAIGVALLGPAGVLLGGGTRSRGVSRPTIMKLAMKVYVNDLIRPCFEVVFYKNSRGSSANGIVVSNAASRLDEWYGRFRTILAMQSNTEGTRPVSSEQNIKDLSEASPG